MEKIERQDRTLMYEGTILKIYRDVVRIPNGSTEVWDFIHHNGAAAVVPVLDDGRILMVRQTIGVGFNRLPSRTGAGCRNRIRRLYNACNQ